MIEMFMSNLGITMLSLWTLFAIYAAWYFTKAKHYAPITSEEARQLWTIHQSTTRCRSRKWRQVKNHGKTVGIQCGCGYKHVQLRPIVTLSHEKTGRLQTYFNAAQPPQPSS